MFFFFIYILKILVYLDLDTIAFGDVPILRYFFSKGRPILSIDPIIARQDLGISRKSFIDLCILCGTDFSGTIQGIGPHKALQAIQNHGSIERMLDSLDSRYTPQDTFNYTLARHVSRPRSLCIHDLTFYYFYYYIGLQ